VGVGWIEGPGAGSGKRILYADTSVEEKAFNTEITESAEFTEKEGLSS